MAREVSQWELNAGDNQFSTADGGMPEGQLPSSVNNSTRERMRATRNWYENSAWHDLLSRYTLAWVSATSFSVAHDTTPTDATAKFPVGARMQITHNAGATVTKGHVVSATYSSPNTTVIMEMDGAVALVSTVTKAEIVVTRDELGKAAFVGLGTAAGEVPQNSDLGDAAYVDQGAGNGLDADTVDGLEAADIVASVLSAPQLILNPGFQIWQRGKTFTAATAGDWQNDNDTVLADAWGLLSESNDLFDVTEELANTPTNAGHALKLTGATVPAADHKGGLIHIIEAADVYALKGQQYTFSISVRNGTGTLDDIRMAVLGWTGAADACPMDVISAWNAAGADPTLVANWAIQGSSASHAVNGTWTQYTVTATISASVTNAALFVWTDSASWGTGEDISFSAADFVPGASARTFRDPSFDDELRRCQHRFYKTFDHDTAPAQNAGLPGAQESNKNLSCGSLFFFNPRLLHAGNLSARTYSPTAATPDYFGLQVVLSNPVASDHIEIITGAAAADTVIHYHVESRFP